MRSQETVISIVFERPTVTDIIHVLCESLWKARLVFLTWLISYFQAYNGHHQALEVLLQSLVDLDIKDEKGRTALDLAAFKGHAECVEALISQGASVTVKDNVTKRTPLHASGECALVLHLQYKASSMYAASFRYLLSLCLFLLNGRNLDVYGGGLAVNFVILMVFLLCPMVRLSLTEAPAFPHSILLGLYLLTCALPYLHYTYSKMWGAFPTALSLNGSLAKRKTGRENSCFTAYPREKIVENTGRPWWQWNCSVFKTFSLFWW